MAVLGNTDLTGCNSIPDFIPTGTRILFYQAAAPTGWTKITDHNNKALRVVSGNGGGSGGSTAFTSVFTSRTTAGSVSAHTLTSAQLPAHKHFIAATSGYILNVDNKSLLGEVPLQSLSHEGYGGTGQTQESRDYVLERSSSVPSAAPTSNPINDSGQSVGGGSHSHGFVGGAMDFSVQYIDVIICSKN